MPAYKFKATDKKNELVTDVINASSEKEAEEILRDKKLNVLVIETPKDTDSLLHRIKKGGFSLKEKIYFCRNLSLLLNAGIPLGDAFELLIGNASNNTVKKVLQELSLSIREGETISSGLAKYPQFFNNLFLVLVKTGESSGSLADSFKYLAKEFQQESDLKQKVFSSMMYPVVIICLMFGEGFLLITFVLPKIGKSLMALNMDLPLPTKILFQTSMFMEKNFILILLLVIIAGIGLVFFIKSKFGKNSAYRLALKLPLFRKILLEYNMARFTRILSTLLTSGVPVTEALETSSKSLTLGTNEEFFTRIQKKLNAGVSLSAIFKEETLFPSMVNQIISIGEKTGNLDSLLADLSGFYKDEVENSLKNFVAILEPLLMIVVGIVIGAMVIAVVAPIYSIISRLSA